MSYRFGIRLLNVALAALALTSGVSAAAEPSPFDLVGPVLEVKVTRGDQTLPVSQVPNLAPGDRLWIKADLPDSQSAHYLMITAFLRGSTNPPPSNWFTRCDTWVRACGRVGQTVTIPKEAQQVLVFLAPQSNGDFRTLVDAVQGRPGAFVRASQDLNQAMLDRSRLEQYVISLQTLDSGDPERLKQAGPLLARSLALRVDPKCLERVPELQIACLMQAQGSVILNDGHSASIVESLTSGSVRDFAMQASSTPQLAYGYYSPYLASIFDIARIMDSFRTAQYQYLPALASPHSDRVSLTLNTPPSFHDPKSVLVVALPSVEAPQFPPLRAVDPAGIYCARKTALVLPTEGAPLVFSTEYARNLTLSITAQDGKTVDLPAKPNAEQGGLVVDTSGLVNAKLSDSIHGALHGLWGFERYDGPTFQLVNSGSQQWSLDAKDDAALLVGRESIVHLQAASVSCVDGIMLRDPAGKEMKTEWKPVRPDEVEVTLPLQAIPPGTLTLMVKQFGDPAPQSIALQAFSEPGHLDAFTLHAGDTQGNLTGTRLGEVSSLNFNGVEFTPARMAAHDDGDELTMSASDPDAARSRIKSGDTGVARIALADGRSLRLKVSVATPRPVVRLIGKSVQLSTSDAHRNIELTDADELPQDALLSFSVRATAPASFPRDESIEIATVDGAFSASLSLTNGGITMANASVAVASFDPRKAFGSSAYGPLQFRAVRKDANGDWQPLGTLVRLPALRELKCPSTSERACTLTGSDLFLVDALSTDAQFDHPLVVPDGFPGSALPVPHPTEGHLYLKLRDDPTVINLAQLAPTPVDPAAGAAPKTGADQTAAEPPTAVSAAHEPLSQ